MTRDSPKWTLEMLKVDHVTGNVEGADLQNKSQSTTHVDPKLPSKTYAMSAVIDPK